MNLEAKLMNEKALVINNFYFKYFNVSHILLFITTIMITVVLFSFIIFISLVFKSWASEISSMASEFSNPVKIIILEGLQ